MNKSSISTMKRLGTSVFRMRLTRNIKKLTKTSKRKKIAFWTSRSSNPLALINHSKKTKTSNPTFPKNFPPILLLNTPSQTLMTIILSNNKWCRQRQGSRSEKKLRRTVLTVKIKELNWWVGRTVCSGKRVVILWQNRWIRLMQMGRRR